MKRFTIDVPVELHRRVRAACAKRGLKVSSVLRDLLEREFPETSGQFRLPLSKAPAGVPLPDNQYPPGSWCRDHGGQGF